jgi:hypothetical protein
MTTRKRRVSDDEIERDAIEKSLDPAAWEAMPPSQPSIAPRPAWMSRDRHMELAAEFHVLSVLHRLGIGSKPRVGAGGQRGYRDSRRRRPGDHARRESRPLEESLADRAVQRPQAPLCCLRGICGHSQRHLVPSEGIYRPVREAATIRIPSRARCAATRRTPQRIIGSRSLASHRIGTSSLSREAFFAFRVLSGTRASSATADARTKLCSIRIRTTPIRTIHGGYPYVFSLNAVRVSFRN